MWQILGIGLLIWAAYDLFSGQVYLHRSITRQEEPGFYWSVWMLYLVIAIVLVLWG